MKLRGEAVPDRHAGVLRELLYARLAKASVLDAVEHAAGHARGVGEGLLLAALARGRVEVDGVHAEVRGTDLKGAARTRGGLLKDEGDVFPLKVAVGLASMLLCLEIGGEVDEIANLLGGEVKELQEIATREANRHVLLPSGTAPTLNRARLYFTHKCNLGTFHNHDMLAAQLALSFV